MAIMARLTRWFRAGLFTEVGAGMMVNGRNRGMGRYLRQGWRQGTAILGLGTALLLG